MKVAQPDDWETSELPPERARLSFEREFTNDEVELMRRGYVPEQMEDKWFIYWEDDALYFHRSWTGFCIYVIRLMEERVGYAVRDAEVNRCQDQYPNTSDDLDVQQVLVLINVLLLRLLPEPPQDGDSGDAALAAWANLGRASLGKHPK